MAAIGLSINVPSIDELVEHWSLIIRPRTWDLDILGNRYTIQYVPNAQEHEVWRANCSGYKAEAAPTFEELIRQLAASWHLAICHASVAEQVKQAVEAASEVTPRPAVEPRTDPADADKET